MKLHFLIPKTPVPTILYHYTVPIMLYHSQIKRKYKSWYKDKIDCDDISDISKSFEAVVERIEKIKPDIIEKSIRKVVLSDLVSTFE